DCPTAGVRPGHGRAGLLDGHVRPGHSDLRWGSRPCRRDGDDVDPDCHECLGPDHCPRHRPGDLGERLAGPDGADERGDPFAGPAGDSGRGALHRTGIEIGWAVPGHDAGDGRVPPDRHRHGRRRLPERTRERGAGLPADRDGCPSIARSVAGGGVQRRRHRGRLDIARDCRGRPRDGAPPARDVAAGPPSCAGIRTRGARGNGVRPAGGRDDRPGGAGRLRSRFGGDARGQCVRAIAGPMVVEGGWGSAGRAGMGL
ncbi:MAG: hypothetical protein AVDCRST_MAG70-1826, partial [uncultured Thermomicrobiales bacterium]